MTPPVPRLRAFLAAGLCLLAGAALRDWLYAGTRRLYVDQRLNAEEPANARQRFVVEAGRVQPEILAPRHGRLVFAVPRWPTSELRLAAATSGRATLEIAGLDEDGRGRRVLARHEVAGSMDVVQDVPRWARRLELSNQEPVTWRDPRVVGRPWLWPWAVALAAVWLALRLRAGPGAAPAGPPPRPVLAGLTAVGTAGLCAAVLEAGLRSLGPALPPWIAAARRDLGEVRPDPRWQDSAHYGPRLRPGVRTFCEWRHGDIVRLGCLPPELAPRGRLRFPLSTDAEGFRNDTPPGPSPVVALGDSFTDGLTLPAERTWPSRLQAHLGAPVRNYGTAGFGPLQELEVLREFVLPRRPRVAVLAFFAGNDLVDAEQFEDARQGGAWPARPGWPIKDVVARYDELYVGSLFHGAAKALRERQLEDVAERDVGDGVHPDVFAQPAPGPAFDRGLFSLPVGGRTLRFALLPAYLNMLRFSAAELEARRGFKLTAEALAEMKDLLQARGGTLVVMFIPSKSQVYLPLLSSTLQPDERERALRFLLPDGALTFEAAQRNRLALNGLVRRLCAREGIAFLDLTAPLEAEVRAGRQVYFADDSHWNAAGHETAARALAEFVSAGVSGANGAAGPDVAPAPASAWAPGPARVRAADTAPGPGGAAAQ